MSTVAQQLRGAREMKKLTVQQVADATKIRSDHISALDEGNFGVFSAPVYIRGSVKNYATLLKLDLPPLLAALENELGRTEKFSEPPPFTGETKKPLDRMMFFLARLNLKMAAVVIAILGVILIAGIIYAVVKHHKNHNPLANLPPARYQPAGAGDTLPLPKR